MAGTFEIKTTKSGQFTFALRASNGQVILTSEQYTTKAAALRGIESVRRHAASASIETPAATGDNEAWIPYIGQWIALDGDEVVDHDDDPGVLYARLTTSGMKNTRFFRVGTTNAVATTA